MKLIVAGSRTIVNYALVSMHIEEYVPRPSEIVCGMAEGVDMLGYRWAEKNGVWVERFPANWKKFGKRAGILRNREMAEYADALLAFWDGWSRGTRNMIECMTDIGKPCTVKRVLCTSRR